MKRILSFFLLLALSVTQMSFSQTISSHKIFGMSKNIESESIPKKNVLIFLPTIPVNFNKLEKDSTGVWRIGAAISGGIGGTFVLGKATQNQDMTTVDSWLLIGGAINYGIKQDISNKAVESLSFSIFGGFSNITISYSHDVLDGKNSFGLSLKMDLLTNLFPDSYIPLAVW